MIRLLQLIPLFGVLLFAYWFFVAIDFFPHHLNTVIHSFRLPSGATWKPTWGDVMVMLGVITLYFELFKATRTTEASIFDHMLSTFVLIGYLVVWLIYPWGGNSVFLILAAMSFLDVIAGFTITISSARRDLALGANI